MDTISNSGDLNNNTTGRATSIKTVKNTAPIRPPNSEDAKAADRARAA